MSVDHDRFELRRTYPAEVSRVFAHWSQPELKRRWFCEQGAEYESDFRPGGVELSSGASPSGLPIRYVGRYSDIVADERIIYGYDLFDGEGLLSASLVSVEFLARGTETTLTLVESLAFPGGRDRAEYRRNGVGTQLGRLQDLLGGGS